MPKYKQDEISDIRDNLYQLVRRLRALAGNDEYVLGYIVRPLEDIINGTGSGATIDKWIEAIYEGCASMADSDEDLGDWDA